MGRFLIALLMVLPCLLALPQVQQQPQQRPEAQLGTQPLKETTDSVVISTEEEDDQPNESTTAQQKPASFLGAKKEEEKNQTTVQTKYGQVNGFSHLIGNAPEYGAVTADIFLGIPFAQPPVGKLRFEKPEPPTPFENGLLDATKFSKACASFAPLTGSPLFSEDCLYLNVMVPPKKAQIAEGFPVVVWIHGGGFASGASQLYGYKEMAANFVSRGIVVVTVQYRLGMFGFMSTGDRVMPGNLGLWDQRAALLWVQENIRAFGGDAKRVTVWGENAGSASTGALSLSKQTRNLFAQAIQMSGSIFSEWALSDSVVDTSRIIAKHLNCPTKVSKKMKACLKEKSSEEISAAGGKMGWLRDDLNFVRMQPRLDGDFFEADLDVLLLDAPKKPTLQGMNSQESMVLTMPFPGAPKDSHLVVSQQEMNGFNGDRVASFINRTIVSEKDYGERTAAARDAVKSFYADRHNLTLDGPKDARFYLSRYTQILTDLQYVVPTLTEVSKKSQEDWPVYLYLINYMNPRFQLPVRGAFQTYEFPYLFGFSIVGNFQFDNDDFLFQQQLVLSLANFIGTGNPSTHLAVWPPVDSKHPFAFMDLGPRPVLRDGLMQDRLALWREFSAKFPRVDSSQKKFKVEEKF